jgi:hypothetical protein
MAVPEAPMNKNGGAMTGKNDVRPAGQISPVEAEPESSGM